MADVIKSGNEVQIVAAFTDGDDRTISWNNPDPSLSVEQLADKINEASAYCKEHNILLGDKAGADFVRFKTARKIVKTTKYLDVSDE